MISGFFAFIMMEKQSLKVFCSTKLLRIGVPFVSVLIIINLPQFIILDYLREHKVSEQINTNSLVGHLWFLVNLLVYFLIYALAHKSMKFLNRLLLVLPSIASIWLIVLLAPFFYIFILALNKAGIAIYSDIPLIGNIHHLFTYFDYFLVGALIARLKHDVFIDNLQSVKGVVFLTFLALISSVPWLYPTVLNPITTPYIHHIQATFVSILIWLVAMHIMNKNSGPLKHLANASYSVYLFHQSIIIMLVLLTNYLVSRYEIEVNAQLVFILIICIPLVITIFIHNKIVKKNHFLSLLFNGKSLPKAQVEL